MAPRLFWNVQGEWNQRPIYTRDVLFSLFEQVLFNCRESHLFAILSRKLPSFRVRSNFKAIENPWLPAGEPCQSAWLRQPILTAKSLHHLWSCNIQLRKTLHYGNCSTSLRLRLRDGILMLDVKEWISPVCHLLSWSDIHPHLKMPWVGLHNAACARLTVEKRLDRGPGYHSILQGLVSFPPPDLVSSKNDPCRELSKAFLLILWGIF